MTLEAITPEHLLDATKLKIARDTAAKVVMAAAGFGTQSNVTVRPLTPQDLYGATSPTAVFSNQVAIGAGNSKVAETGLTYPQQNRAWVFFGYGVTASLPHIQELWIGSGANSWARLRLTPIYVQGSANAKAGYFDPIYFAPTIQPVLYYVTDQAVLANAETFELIGLVAEPPNVVVNQEPVASIQAPTQVPAA